LKPRFHIIGGPGSGKTYIAGKLAAKLGLTARNLDDLFWAGSVSHYGVRANAAERDRRLANVGAGDGWIIEGVYYQWLGPSFATADVIIVLAPCIWLRHWRVVRRFLLRKLGRLPGKRESLADLWDLLRWSHDYDRNQLARAREVLAGNGHKWIVCRTFDDVLTATAIMETV
jgi:adenylate kinase family enzyme